MQDELFVDGNASVAEPFELKKEIALFKDDPMDPFIKVISPNVEMLSNDASRYKEAYLFYFLSLKRYFTDMYYAKIWDQKLKWVHRDRKKYSPTQRKVLPKVYQHNDYLELDFADCILHGRILCDRTISLSSYFLVGPKLPSFTSFSDHKKFLVKNRTIGQQHEEYATFIESNTGWFEKSLKQVRDKYVVHTAQKHMKFYGYATDQDLSMVLFLPEGPPGKELSKVQPVNISIRRLARDVRGLLIWFASYALRNIPTGK